MENNTNVNGNAPVNNANPKPKKSIFKRWWFWVIVGIVLIVIIAAAASGGSDEKGNSSNGDATVTEAPEDKTEFGVGETINYDGVKITLKDFKESKGDKKSFVEPNKGKIYVIGNFEVKNDSDEKINVNWASFEGYYDDNAIEPDVIGQSLPQVKKMGELFGDVAPGKKIKGGVVFEVPKKWKKMEIIPKFDFDFGDEQNCKYIINNK